MLEEILRVLNEINENLKGGMPETIKNPTTNAENLGTTIAATAVTSTIPAAQPVVEVPQVQAPQIQPTVATPVIPTAEVTGYTQEQLARAMATRTATDEGRVFIQNIMAQFGVQALTDLDPSRYNELAAKLTEAGVQI